MQMYDLIMKKRNGGVLNRDEIDFFINGYTKGEIPDYQVSALMMAIFFRGMNTEETVDLTMAMAHSGEVLDLKDISGIKCDKHSTGGVGDKTTLSLIPMVVSCGCKVAKMSGRGLGHTGGTIDKLESFPGFSTSISDKQFIDQVRNIGVSVMGQTVDLAPADKKLYALRDVTATVDNMSLIASSIMSKKLASGADAIVLDVKCGSGAFMKNLDDAKALAKAMTDIGKGAGRRTKAVISDMDQPLGRAVGNAIEVREAIETLKGNGPDDFTRLCMELGSRMLIMSDVCDNLDDAKVMLEDSIKDGRALDTLARFVKAQGGDESYVYDPSKLKVADRVTEVKAKCDGYVSHIECDEIGMVSLTLGGGRVTKESEIDLSVGLILEKKVGDRVKTGDVLARIYASDPEKESAALQRFEGTYEISESAPEQRDIIIDSIE
ncbi:MAG: pyrimidine-nucleoside phosphorylase [Lachnospiraceae bacterium]|nr:pyrimidine-nucleoside phosphorylase [Lachnospiraceae bacterium]